MQVAAAPHLFGDALVASPELALVDADLAARLRAVLPDEPSVAEPSIPRAVADLEIRVVPDPVFVDVAEWDDAAVDASPEPVDLGHGDLDDDRPVDVDEPVLPSASEWNDACDPLQDLVPALVDVPEPGLGDEAPEPSVDVVAYDDPLADILLDPSPAQGEVDHDVARGAVEASAADIETQSNYPTLPDLDGRSDALDVTDAALRRIREQLGGGTELRRIRVRRRFTVASGLGAAAALAVMALDVQTGVVHVPGWLAF